MWSVYCRLADIRAGIVLNDHTASQHLTILLFFTFSILFYLHLPFPPCYICIYPQLNPCTCTPNKGLYTAASDANITTI